MVPALAACLLLALCPELTWEARACGPRLKVSLAAPLSAQLPALRVAPRVCAMCRAARACAAQRGYAAQLCPPAPWRAAIAHGP